MEKWLNEMQFMPPSGDLNEFLAEFKRVSNPSTTKVWKHIITHVRPKLEVSNIRKRCLLHKLSSSSPPYYNIEENLNSVKDFNLYIKNKNDTANVKKIMQQIEEKKKSIAERLNNLKLHRHNSCLEEEKVKEVVNKINNLKKKRKTVERCIEKFENDTKVLKTLRTSPNDYVNFGLMPSIREIKTLRYVGELTPGSEIETITTEMGKLHHSIDFPELPLTFWDRTITFTEMDKIFLTKQKVKDSKKLELQEINKKLEIVINSIMDKIPKDKCNTINTLKSLLDNYVERKLKEAVTLGKNLVENNVSYVLETERLNIRRLNQLIESKASEVSKFLPLQNAIPDSVDTLVTTETVLPNNPNIEKLINSVSKEVKLFLDLPLRQNINDNVIDYIQPSVLILKELKHMNNLMVLNAKLHHLQDKVSNMDLTNYDSVQINHGSNGFSPNTMEMLKYFENEAVVMESIYERVKAAFNFLRKEPLNEKLTGLQIEDQDISYWLSRFLNSKVKYDHESWLQTFSK